MKWFLLGMIFSSLAISGQNDLLHRPKSFQTTIGKAVFVDFTTAHYDIVYDMTTKRAEVTASIKFEVPEAGYPIFDSVKAPTSIYLNGVSITATETKTPEGETTLRVMDKSVTVGTHVVEIKVPLEELVEFRSDSTVVSAFWTSDLDERNFLEQYMPANFEFDQVKMTFSVAIKGVTDTHKIYTNGIVTSTQKNRFTITYPSYFTASSIFFHLVPEGATNELRFSLKSIDGREIPAVVYNGSSIFSSSLSGLKQQTTDVFHELEKDYGAWPHPVVIVYNAGWGGMEYCGATMTDSSSLGHELFHSYFARGVMPANGNSGWLDEALASWRDNGYKRLTRLSGSSKMSSHPYYTRTTDDAAYSFGENFMRLMDGTVAGKGGLRPFMRHMVEHRRFAPLFVEEFQKEMSVFYGIDVTPFFKQYTYGSTNVFAPMKSRNNKIHRKMSLKELKNYL